MTAGDDLPAGWKRSKLGALLEDIQPGFASGRHNSEGEGLPHLRPMNVSSRGVIDRAVVKSIDPALANRSERRLRKGDVLFNNTNSPELVGKTAYFDGDDEPAFSNHMTRLRPDRERLLPDYLARRLHFAWMQGYFAARCNNHVSQASVGRAILNDMEIEVPPLEVQRAITDLVAKIERQRTSAIAHLDASRQAIECFRQAVLAAACSGRLTEDWRIDNEPAETASVQAARIDEARQRRLGSRYKSSSPPDDQGEPPNGWCWTTVGALLDVATGATPLRKRLDYYNGTVPWVMSGAVNAGVITSATEYITEAAIRETNAKVFPAGTLLVAMYGEGQTRGRVGELGIDAATNQAVAALLFDEETAYLKPYIKLFLLENYERVRTLSFGGVQPNSSLGAIRETPVPLPPRGEQFEIAKRVDELFTLASRLVQHIEAAARYAELSSQAILAKAFRGELSNLSKSA